MWQGCQYAAVGGKINLSWLRPQVERALQPFL